MDEKVNTQVARLLNDLADRFDMATRVVTARFTGGGEGYSIALRTNGATDPKVITFYNDDEFGPRYIGKAGARVPAHKVIPYAAAIAADPGAHPSMLNHTVLGR